LYNCTSESGPICSVLPGPVSPLYTAGLVPKIIKLVKKKPIKRTTKINFRNLSDEKDLVKLIKTYREKKGLTQEKLAKMIGCSTMTINLFESKGRNMSINKIFAICRELGIVISWQPEI